MTVWIVFNKTLKGSYWWSDLKPKPLLWQINSETALFGCYEVISEIQRRGGELEWEEKDKSKGVVETRKQWSSVERSEWRQCGHAHCGHSAGTKCGRWDANYWSTAKDLSPCWAFSLSFCLGLNNEWELAASHPTCPPKHSQTTSPYPIPNSFNLSV